ncbi:putative membrane protein [Kordia periserrulae]|uniref:Putative membrane protein n=1 Tax=Kordia periserrulae TaxID=701523 RepID=A0A2T6BRL3_9FLAO|nr:DUF2157 domain-containing protein [Kordia periserrulae]PTX58725.1 putative membrane protein [Kordia periserrulae]
MSLKITNALPELVENNIITEETAQKIIAYYDKPKEVSNSNKLFIVFGILGAALVGLGIILIMAHNWDELPKFVKLIAAFFPMILGQVALGYSIAKNKSMLWKETATVFLYFSVGACIALVSQVYHISGNLESFILAWTVLCTPLLYVTKSKSAIFLHLIFSTYYALITGYGYNVQTTPLLYFVLISACIPRYISSMKEKESAIANALHWLLPASLLLSLPVCYDRSPQIAYLLYMFLFGIYINIGQFPYFKNKSLLQNGYLCLGTIGTIILLLLTSFHDAWKYDFRYGVVDTVEVISVITLFLGACFVFYINTKFQKLQQLSMFQLIFLVFGIIFLIGLVDTATATILINILLFAIGIVLIKKGADHIQFSTLNYGMVIITALIICRFYDTEISFAIRGLIFLSIGVGFFITNYIMYKKQLKK